MLGIPRRNGHFAYGVIQSGLTTAIATAIASLPFLDDATFMLHWFGAGHPASRRGVDGCGLEKRIGIYY